MNMMEKTIKTLCDKFTEGLTEGLEKNKQPLIDLELPTPLKDSEVIIYREPLPFEFISLRDRPTDVHFRYEPFYIKVVIDLETLNKNEGYLVDYYAEQSVRDTLNGLADRSKVFHVGELVELSYKPLFGQYIEVELKVNVVSPRS